MSMLAILFVFKIHRDIFTCLNFFLSFFFVYLCMSQKMIRKRKYISNIDFILLALCLVFNEAAQ